MIRRVLVRLPIPVRKINFDIYCSRGLRIHALLQGILSIGVSHILMGCAALLKNKFDRQFLDRYAVLRASAKRKHKEVTYTCVPPGSGTRIAIDRNENGILDRDEM